MQYPCQTPCYLAFKFFSIPLCTIFTAFKWKWKINKNFILQQTIVTDRFTFIAITWFCGTLVVYSSVKWNTSCITVHGCNFRCIRRKK